jgi:L-ascorbate metabolism protein UlaG (beta-lactamase superfamily)
MAIAFTWLGHSAFQMDIDGHPILFDPFLTNNPLAAKKADDIKTEIILLSHGHGDHVGDTVAIARRTRAPVITNFEVGNWLRKQGAEAHGQNTGGKGDYGFMTVKLTLAFHSSSLPDGTYGGNPNGFLVTAKASGQKLYFAGDTALFSDMQLIGDEGIDIALLPIGDYFTMGIDDSIKAIKLLRPRFVAPMHYNTFDAVAQDAGTWANRVSSETNATPIVLDPGGSFAVPSRD